MNLICSWRPRYTNSLENIALYATLYKGFPELPGFYGSAIEATELRSLRFRYGLVRMGHSAYVAMEGSTKEFSPEQLADYLLSQLMEVVDQIPRE